MRVHQVPRSGSFLGCLIGSALCIAALSTVPEARAQGLNLSQLPLFLAPNESPLVMLTMARDHKLFYEAYNDYSDLNEDGSLDVGYKPDKIDYYGYFDSYKCYEYSSGEFVPRTTRSERDTRSRANGAGVPGDKTCSNQWSGDFLNYVTMSRMDALRRVLYGGYRSTDTSSKTVLERAFIPQDAHSWGKEYQSVTRDGYDIRDYAPLGLPDAGRYHIFANVTLSRVTNPPLMRVLTNTERRVWEWLSIERPVAGSDCFDSNNNRISCVPTGGATSELVPSSAFTDLKKSTWKNPVATTEDQFADSAAEFDDWMNRIAISANALESNVSISQINCPNNSCDPAGRTDDYITRVTGKLTAPVTGTYTLIIDGDDAVDVRIGASVLVGWYGGHGFANNDSHSATISLTAGQTYDIEFRHQERGGGSGYLLKWIRPSSASAMTDYTVRVEVCRVTGTGDSNDFTEPNCKSYGSGGTAPKPSGLLHTYGENRTMAFGLLTGSYDNNTKGGRLRKKVGWIEDELNSDGTFKCGGRLTTSCTPGIVGTINRLRITGFRYPDDGSSYDYRDSSTFSAPMQDNKSHDWGNPLGEMVYESMRYFAGKASPTADFTSASGRENGSTFPNFVLPSASWVDPYSTSVTALQDGTDGTFPFCAKPYIMAVSDTYPSFDSDQVPGTAFGSFSGDISGLNVSTLGQNIWDAEFGSGALKDIFIGQSGTTKDGAPSVKSASSFGNIRGLAPGEPTREGSYSTAALAYHAHTQDLSATPNVPKLNFFSVALAAPLPNIEIPIERAADGTASRSVRLVPFAKSPWGCLGLSDDASQLTNTTTGFRPTNQIVDFYVESVENGDGDASTCTASSNPKCPRYVFRINYEDVEQGNDHDMDAIVKYTVELFNDNGTAKVRVSLSSDYAAGCVVHHVGYVMSGTTQDGIYLDVRDKDTTSFGGTNDRDYVFDTPTSTNAPYPNNTGANTYADSQMLPLQRIRTFTPSASASAATVLNDPLWYAAKWGGFDITDPDNPVIPADDATSWDADGNGIPDNYFLVVNPLKMEQQLGKAFNKIFDESGSASSVAANSTSLRTGLRLYVARFVAKDWSGELDAFDIHPLTGGLSETPVWSAQNSLEVGTTRTIFSYDPDVATATDRGIVFDYSAMTATKTDGSPGTLRNSLDRTADGTIDATRTGTDRVDYLRGQAGASWTRQRPCVRGTSRSAGDCQETVLGDIINSSARFVGVPDLSGNVPTSYHAFRTEQSDRRPMIYIGANDGMLHGFDATNGEEMVAYVPSEMYRARPISGSAKEYRLSKLVQADYGLASNAHAYYVDGSPTVSDVCTGTCSTKDDWKTLLVGGLNAGGQGIFALNITNPGADTSTGDFAESATNARKVVLWEFNDWQDDNSNGIGDDDTKYGLGYTFSKPGIARVCTARNTTSTSNPKPCTTWKWAVLFGNGYNNTESDGFASSTGHALLYVLNAADGKPLAKINTRAGTSTQPNGIANITAADIDGDSVVDYVYGGDLKGNLWKFDLTGNTTSDWKVAFGTASAPLPLFVAKDAAATPKLQPITSAPALRGHPLGGIMVLFGTGKYIESGTDPSSSDQQTFYGIWDRNDGIHPDLDRTDLQVQSVLTASTSFEDTTLRSSTDNTVDWSTQSGWYLDFPTSSIGERVVADPQLLSNATLFFTSIVPTPDPCTFGGDSWNYFVNPETGGRLSFNLIDGAPQISVDADTLAYASSYKSSVGVATRGLPIGGSQGRGFVYQSGSKSGDGDGGGGGGGGIPPECRSANNVACLGVKIPGDRGRVSWREITND